MDRKDLGTSSRLLRAERRGGIPEKSAFAGNDHRTPRATFNKASSRRRASWAGASTLRSSPIWKEMSESLVLFGGAIASIFGCMHLCKACDKRESMKPMKRKWWRHCGCLSSSQEQDPSDEPSKPEDGRSSRSTQTPKHRLHLDRTSPNGTVRRYWVRKSM